MPFRRLAALQHDYSFVEKSGKIQFGKTTEQHRDTERVMAYATKIFWLYTPLSLPRPEDGSQLADSLVLHCGHRAWKATSEGFAKSQPLFARALT